MRDMLQFYIDGEWVDPETGEEVRGAKNVMKLVYKRYLKDIGGTRSRPRA